MNRVVPREQLETATLELASEIARRPSFGLKIAKAAVNQSLDAQGQWTALQSAFSLHQLAHAQAKLVWSANIDPTGFGLTPDLFPSEATTASDAHQPTAPPAAPGSPQ